MPFTIDWSGAWNDPERKAHIHREVVSAFGNRTGSVTFEIGRASDGVGITIRIHGTPNPASEILWPGEEWRKHGVLEKKVRKVMEDAEQGSGSAERSMVGKAHARTYKPRS
jgi:hypothetical protein